MPTRRHLLQSAARAGLVSITMPHVLLGKEGPTQVQSGLLVESMERVGRCCLAWLNPEQEYLPTGGYEVAHDTGRWWDAMLRLEAATGTAIPAPVEAAMLKNLEILTDNPAALLTNTARLPIAADKIKLNPHNLRETMLAYYALVKWRKSDWARKQGHKLLEAIQQTLEADGQMDYAKLATLVGRPLTKDPLMVQRSPSGQWFNATGTTGRALEAIVLFHEATQDPLALEVARRLAAVHFKHSIDPAGKVRAELTDPNHVGHTHSYLGTLRGLLLYGLTIGDNKYVDAVASTYRKGLFGTCISHSGWTPHDQGKLRFPDKEGDPLGEHASCGDVAQIALWLALHAKQADLLDDVERMIRARLLPSQIVDAKTPRSDGAWGVYNHPFGRGNILDVFAAVLHSLADFHTHIVTQKPEGQTFINLHFDLRTDDLTIKAERKKQEGKLSITLHKAQDLRIRVPSWVSRDSLHLMIGEQSLPIDWQGDFLSVPRANEIVSKTIVLHYGLPTRTTTEVMAVSQRKFNLTWRGDEVIACDPKVAIYPGKSA